MIALAEAQDFLVILSLSVLLARHGALHKIRRCRRRPGVGGQRFVCLPPVFADPDLGFASELAFEFCGISEPGGISEACAPPSAS